MGLTFEQWLTLLAFIGGGIGAAWTVFVKVVLPAKLKAAERRLEAELADQVDQREYQQKQRSLEQAYQISEVSAAHQIMAELVANANEELAETYRFIRENVLAALEQVEDQTRGVSQIQTDLAKLKYDYRNLATKINIMTGLISEMYEDYKSQMRPTDEYFE